MSNLKTVTRKQIEKARTLTRERWNKVSRATSRSKVDKAISSTRCGFCHLSNKTGGVCFSGKCPIRDGTRPCCKAWTTYDKLGNLDSTVTLDDVTYEAELLVKRLDNFDVEMIVETINKRLEGVRDKI